eukprot:gene4717-3381_t
MLRAVLVFLWVWLSHRSQAQVPDPVFPLYNASLLPTFYEHYPMPDNSSTTYLQSVDSIGHGGRVCLTNTNIPAHSVNRPKDFDPEATFPRYLSNNTYWWNEYLHVGHFHYELVLFQLLATQTIDRVVIQRAACSGSCCAGIGSIESYYKGFFAIAFEAFGQPDVPVYLRYTWQKREASPIFFSVHTRDFYNENNATVSSRHFGEIPLQPQHCFDNVLRRSHKATYGRTLTVSRATIDRFRRTAYRVVNEHVRRFGLAEPFSYFAPSVALTPPLPPLRFTPLAVREFSATNALLSPLNASTPQRILVAYRGPSGTRFVVNLPTLLERLRATFPPPRYELAVLDTSQPKLTFLEQLHAVASSDVVISNHGAFEANMIYMQRGALLVELFGVYGNNEVHTFHRLAMSLGLFYARWNCERNSDHQLKSFNLTDHDVARIEGVLVDYFRRRAFRHPIS